MATWKDRIPGCFGAVDKIFAGHPNDQERAREMLGEAIDAGASMKDIKAEARKFLEKEGCKADHVERQLEEMGKRTTSVPENSVSLVHRAR